MINGYKQPFLQQNVSGEKYIAGTTLEEIYALYEFDRKLRIVTLEYILEIEKQVKALLLIVFQRYMVIKIILKLKILIQSELTSIIKYVFYLVTYIRRFHLIVTKICRCRIM